MQRCEHVYKVKFNLVSRITAECTICHETIRLRKKYEVIGYLIGFSIYTLIYLSLSYFNVAHWIMLVLLPICFSVYIIAIWLMYHLIAKACQRQTELSRYFDIPEK